MPSPFPGMDPYLEAPDIWPDFHEAFASEIRGFLNHALPAPYYARLEMRPEVGIAEESAPRHRIVPDVAVAAAAWPSGAGGVTVLDTPRSAISQHIELKIATEPIRHAFVEIRDPARGHHLITLIEIVSPSNKRPGVDRKKYTEKQREVLDSDANLIELDLLRTGQRLFSHSELERMIDALAPAPDYLVLVNRAWHRVGAEMGVQIFSISIAEPLPCIPVPLRQEEAGVPLDLQFVFQRAYDSGPYQRGAVDYSKPPAPPLEGAKASWAGTLVKRPG